MPSLIDVMEGKLLNAVRANDPIKVNMLLKNTTDVEKLFALVEASEEGFLEIVQALIQTGIDINQERPFVQGSALRQAAWEGHTQIVRVLLEAGADVILPPQNPKDSTALVLATQEGHFKVLPIWV